LVGAYAVGVYNIENGFNAPAKEPTCCYSVALKGEEKESKNIPNGKML
jgi:hypothetical protein